VPLRAVGRIVGRPHRAVNLERVTAGATPELVPWHAVTIPPHGRSATCPGWPLTHWSP
jgi:hypothetical protein